MNPDLAAWKGRVMRYAGRAFRGVRGIGHCIMAFIFACRACGLLGFWRLEAVTRGRRIKKTVAVSRLEHLGDIVACEPVVREARRRYPDALIVFCVRRPYRELADANPWVDRTIVLSCLTAWIFLVRAGIFDEVLDLHFEGLTCPVCRVPLRKSSGKRDITMDNYYDRGSLPEVFSQAAGVEIQDGEPRVYIPAPAVRKIDGLKLPRRFVAIHGTSLEEERNWPARKWRELVSRITSEGACAVVEIGGESVLKNFEDSGCVDLCGKLSVLETAEVIGRALLFIGVDSGPAHLANAVGTPGVILIGRYMSFEHYMPFSGAYQRGDNVEILYTEQRVCEMPAARVWDAVCKRMETREPLFVNVLT